jgi:hypothetical protein
MAGEIDECDKEENWYGGWLGIYYAPRDPRICRQLDRRVAPLTTDETVRPGELHDRIPRVT